VNAGWWSLLILPISLPLLAIAVWLGYMGVLDIREKDREGWISLALGWAAFWWITVWTAAFIYDNFTP
jgi:hypothetical protein